MHQAACPIYLSAGSAVTLLRPSAQHGRQPLYQDQRRRSFGKLWLLRAQAPASQTTSRDATPSSPTSGSSSKCRPRRSVRALVVARHRTRPRIAHDPRVLQARRVSWLPVALNQHLLYRPLEFAWYSQAHVCYAYLNDVPSSNGLNQRVQASRTSKWFSRGWTLQDPIAWLRSLSFGRRTVDAAAPRDVRFSGHCFRYEWMHGGARRSGDNSGSI